MTPADEPPIEQQKTIPNHPFQTILRGTVHNSIFLQNVRDVKLEQHACGEPIVIVRCVDQDIGRVMRSCTIRISLPDWLTIDEALFRSEPKQERP